MYPRERVLATLDRRQPDRVPRFEIWIDPRYGAPGHETLADVYADAGQDCVMLPTRIPPHSNNWSDGVDEWGQVWRNGGFVDGVVDSVADLETYNPPLEYAAEFFDPDRTRQVRQKYPTHCLIFGSHIGPFTAGYMAMGFERFFRRLIDDPAFVRRLLEDRAAWCIAMFRQAVNLGADVLILGDDAGHTSGSMVSPAMWRKIVLPLHRRIVAAVGVPMIWHTDGHVEALFPMAVEAGFVGIHGVDVLAGMDLAQLKRDWGQHLVLVGNVDVRVLFGSDLDAVRRDVDRCIAAGAPGAGYMIASCNSICAGMNPAAVAKMFRYEGDVGYY